MAQEEIIILKVEADLKQPAQSIDELNKRVRRLRKVLKESPQEGTKQFEELAQRIAKETNVSIEDARKRIVNFQKTAKKEIQQGKAAIKEFNAELRKTPAAANSIQDLRNQVKKLDKEVAQLDTTTEEFVDKSQELRKTRERLKELEAATGDTRRNVGNYTAAIRKAIGQNSIFGKQLSGISRTLKVAFGLQSIRTAISSLSLLYDTIIERDNGANDALNNLTKSTGNLTESFLDLATDALAAIAAPLGKFINAIAFAFDKVRELAGGNSFLGKTFQFVGSIITGTLNRLAKFPAFFSGISAAISQLAANAKIQFSRLSNSIAIAFQEINKFNPFSSQSTEEIEANLEALRKEQNNLINSTRTLSEAFNEAFNATIKEQKAYDERVKTQKSAAERDKESKTIIEALNEEKGKLEKRIKNLIAVNRDFTKEQERLQEVTERLEEIQRKFNEATAEAVPPLEALNNKQQELNQTIRERLLAGEDVSEQVNELIQVTKELTGVDEEFEAINKRIQESLTTIAEGSLADYEKRIKELKEQQKDLNIASSEYADVQAKINNIQNEQNIILDLINQNTDELATSRSELAEQTTDAEAEREALQAALERIAQTTDATQAGANRIEQIEQELANAIKNIEFRRLQETNAALTAQIADVQQAKQRELEIVGENEQLKLAVESKFAKQIEELQLQQLDVQTQILQRQLEAEKAKASQSVEVVKQEEQQKNQLRQQALQFIGQATAKTFELIATVQQNAFQAEQQRLEEAEVAALRNAERIGATEQRKQAIQEQFAQKQEALEKEQARKRKTRAVTQAIIDTALAVLNGLQTQPLIPAGIAAAAFAGALGAAQIGIISAQKFALGDLFDMQVRSGAGNKFARGAYLKNGAYHSQGGMPILNPYTGQKIAEIERGEGIVNRHTMANRQVVTVTGTPYDIVSNLNNRMGKGVRYPNSRNVPIKKHSRGGRFGGYAKISKPKNLSYGFGGRFGVSSNVLKLQQGAVVASSAIANAKRLESDSQTVKLLRDIDKTLKQINNTNKNGFQKSTSTAEDLERVARLQRDEQNAT